MVDIDVSCVWMRAVGWDTACWYFCIVCLDNEYELVYMLLMFLYRVLGYGCMVGIYVVIIYVSCVEIMMVCWDTSGDYLCIVCCDNDDVLRYILRVVMYRVLG